MRVALEISSLNFSEGLEQLAFYIPQLSINEVAKLPDIL